MPDNKLKHPTLVKEAVERLKIAFWASLTNANAGMKWLDHDSMEEIISAAWPGFEEPAMSALLTALPTDDDDTRRCHCGNPLPRDCATCKRDWES